MYAVVKTGGKQYKIQEGDILRFEKIPGEVGSPIKFDQVLMFSDGKNVQIGQPLLENIAVEGRIIEQGKARKIIVFKYKRRKRYRRKLGHRQQFTAVQIDSINAKGSRAGKKPEPAETPKATEAKAEVVKKAETKKPAPKKAAARKPATKKTVTQKAAAAKKPATRRSTANKTTAKAPAKAAANETKDKTE
jgi:large subunit ribosomal protein L21